MVNRRATMHHNNERPFTSQEVDEKLEEGIYCESLNPVYGSEATLLVEGQLSAGDSPHTYLELDRPKRMLSVTIGWSMRLHRKLERYLVSPDDHPSRSRRSIHQKYSHDISLKQRLPVVLPINARFSAELFNAQHIRIIRTVAAISICKWLFSIYPENL